MGSHFQFLIARLGEIDRAERQLSVFSESLFEYGIRVTSCEGPRLTIAISIVRLMPSLVSILCLHVVNLDFQSFGNMRLWNQERRNMIIIAPAPQWTFSCIQAGLGETVRSVTLVYRLWTLSWIGRIIMHVNRTIHQPRMPLPHWSRVIERTVDLRYARVVFANLTFEILQCCFTRPQPFPH